MYVKDGYAYLTTNDLTQELVILNVTNPTNPTLASAYNATPDVSGFGYGRALYTVGDNLYLGRSWLGTAANTPEFSVLNAANPDSALPAPQGALDIGTNTANPFGVKSIIVRDTLAFILTGSARTAASSRSRIFPIRPVIPAPASISLQTTGAGWHGT